MQEAKSAEVRMAEYIEEGLCVASEWNRRYPGDPVCEIRSPYFERGDCDASFEAGATAMAVIGKLRDPCLAFCRYHEEVDKVYPLTAISRLLDLPEPVVMSVNLWNLGGMAATAIAARLREPSRRRS